MSPIERVKRAVTGLAGSPQARLRMTDETRVRVTAAVLWGLIAIAGLGGMLALVRPTPAPPRERNQVEAPSVTVSEAWAAAGFGARAVAGYLATGEVDGSDMTGVPGDGPASETTEPAGGLAVTAVAVDRVGPGYWAVTAAAGEPGREEFWRVGVARRDGRLVVTGLPTPLPAPVAAEQPELAVRAREMPPADDPAVDTVEGWVTAYVCGQGEVSRWLAPGVRLDPVSPPLCGEARLERWGAQPEGEDRLLVVTEVAMDPGASEQRVTFSLALTRRDGRWEVAELLPAPPLSEEVPR